MQRPKQEGLGAAFGGGMTDQAFGARTTDVLQKGTVYLGVLFFVVTFILSILSSAETRREMVIEDAKKEAEKIEAEKEEQLADKENIDDVNAVVDSEEKKEADVDKSEMDDLAPKTTPTEVMKEEVGTPDAGTELLEEEKSNVEQDTATGEGDEGIDGSENAEPAGEE